MESVYDLYGISLGTLEGARQAIQKALGMTLKAHESSYRGGKYFRLHDVGREHFILQRNYIDTDKDWCEPDYPEAAFLLYVNETARSEEIRTALEREVGIKLLRHRTIS